MIKKNGFYKEYLDKALEALFRPIENNGFWNSKNNRLIRALKYEVKDNKMVWFPDYSENWRYTPFAFMGIMYWRNSFISNSSYDNQIKNELEYFVHQINDEKILASMPSYGIGPLIMALSVAFRVFNNKKYKEVAIQLYQYSRNKFDFSNSEDSLLLYGWGWLYEIFPDITLKDNISQTLVSIIQKQNKKGLFIFKNLLTTQKHQNQMYILWGVGKAIEVLKERKYLTNIEKTLDYTIKNRMLPNGALLWEDHVSWLRRLKDKIIKHEPGWNHLFACHQTFFINAIFQYYKAGGNRKYDDAIIKAIDWIYGNNALKKDLVKISGIGVPLRTMLMNGKIELPRQAFKGTYEIGSYIMALTNLLSYNLIKET